MKQDSKRVVGEMKPVTIETKAKIIANLDLTELLDNLKIQN